MTEERGERYGDGRTGERKGDALQPIAGNTKPLSSATTPPPELAPSSSSASGEMDHGLRAAVAAAAVVATIIYSRAVINL